MKDRLVQGGFQKMKCEVKIMVNEGTMPRQLERLQSVAKACCESNARVNTLERYYYVQS